MTATTPAYSLPFPEDSDGPDGPAQIEALALAVEALFTARDAAWSSFTPTLTSSGTNPTLGSGSSALGRYKKIGKTVQYAFEITLGTGATAGTGFYSIGNLPFAARGGNPTFSQTIVAFDSSTGRYLNAAGDIAGGSSQIVRIHFGDSGANTTLTTFGSTVPWTWADGDRVYGSGFYEAA